MYRLGRIAGPFLVRVCAAAAVFGASLFAQLSDIAPLLIRDVTIIDCAGHAPRPAMSVLISGGRIAAIGPAARIEAHANAEILDGRGKYLIPGLCNMHVHLGTYAAGKRALSGYLAEGITCIRDMGSPLDDILRLRQETSDGTISGPAMVVAGPIIQGPLPFQMPVFISVKDAAAARAAVDMLHRRGVDFIKVQDAIPHDLYAAVARQADLGQHSIEHLGGRFWGVLVGSSAFTQAVVESYDPQKAASLIRRFRKNGTWQCPTLVVLHTLWADGNHPR